MFVFRLNQSNNNRRQINLTIIEEQHEQRTINMRTGPKDVIISNDIIDIHMINKIKQSVERKRQTLRNKISIFFRVEEVLKDRSAGQRKQKVVSSGRSFRSQKNVSNLDNLKCENQQPLWNLTYSQLQEDQFKNKLMAHIKKTKMKQQQRRKTFVPSNSYVPKLKHKKSKEHSRRSLPAVTFDQNDNLETKKQQRKVSQIFIGSPNITHISQEEKYSKMNHLSILMAGGRKKKIDSVMYMKKLKTKNQLGETVITQSFIIDSGSQQDCTNMRPLFLRKDLASYKRSNKSLNRKSERNFSAKNHSKKVIKQNQNCRPWSATLSDYQK